MTTATIIGIDVSKAFLDLWVLPQGKAWRVEYTEAGLIELVQELTELQPVRIIVEATGGLETRPGVGVGGRRVARGGGQSPPGAGVCPRYGTPGQDRPAGCSGTGPVRRRAAAAGTSPA